MRRWRALIVLSAALVLTSGPATASAPAPNPAVGFARARELADDAAGAVDDLRAYLSDHPRDVDANRLLGDCLFRLRRERPAEEAWKAALVADPDDGETRTRLGALYTAQNRLPEAVVMYERVLPNAVAADALVGLHTRLGDVRRFLDEVEAWVEHEPRNPDALVLAAAVLRADHQHLAALSYYSQLVSLRRGRCDDLVARANDLLALHRYTEAVADLESCLSVEPDSYEALASLGAAYLNRNDAASAAVWTQRALSRNPNGVQALIVRGLLEDASGEIEAAMRDDQAAIAADPMRSEGYGNFAFALLERGDLAVAEQTLADGLHAAPDNPRLHYLLARTFQLERKPIALTRAEYQAALSCDDARVVRAARAALDTLASLR